MLYLFYKIIIFNHIFNHNEHAMSLHSFTQLNKMDMPHHQFSHIVVKMDTSHHQFNHIIY
jgi:hypothetical protein